MDFLHRAPILVCAAAETKQPGYGI